MLIRTFFYHGNHIKQLVNKPNKPGHDRVMQFGDKNMEDFPNYKYADSSHVNKFQLLCNI